MEPVGRLGHQRDAGQVGERVAISKGDCPPLAYPLGKHLELPAPDAGEHVRHPVVVAELGMLVRDAGVARLGRPEARLVHPVAPRGGEHSAAGGGDDLVAVEGKRRQCTERARGPSLVGRPQRFGRVLQHRHLAAAAGVEDRIHVGALAVEVDCDHRARPSSAPDAIGEGFGEERRAHHPGRRVAVDEDGRRAEITDRVHAGDEGEIGDEHLVARPDAEQP